VRHTTTMAGALLLLATATAAAALAPAEPKQMPDRAPNKPYTAYLMAYFGPQEKLFYAFSRDSR